MIRIGVGGELGTRLAQHGCVLAELNQIRHEGISMEVVCLSPPAEIEILAIQTVNRDEVDVRPSIDLATEQDLVCHFLPDVSADDRRSLRSF
jgi:hypothetical protein